MDQSPFNNLPAELRNRVYHFALVQSDPIRLTTGDGSCGHKVRAVRTPSSRNVLALSRTCKQIRAECVPIFLKGNHFKILPRYCSVNSDMQEAERYTTTLRTWMKALGTWKSCLRSLEIGLMGRTWDIGADDACRYKWSRAINTLKKTCDLPKVQLTVTLEGLINETDQFDGDLTLRIFGDQTDEALLQFERDEKELEARVTREVSSSNSSYYIIRNARTMIKGARHIVRMYARKQ